MADCTYYVMTFTGEIAFQLSGNVTRENSLLAAHLNLKEMDSGTFHRSITDVYSFCKGGRASFEVKVAQLKVLIGLVASCYKIGKLIVTEYQICLYALNLNHNTP